MPIPDDPDVEILICHLAGPLTPPAQQAFRHAAEDALRRVPCWGEGAVYRAVSVLQRAFFEPPDDYRAAWDISKEMHASKLTRAVPIGRDDSRVGGRIRTMCAAGSVEPWRFRRARRLRRRQDLAVAPARQAEPGIVYFKTLQREEVERQLGAVRLQTVPGLRLRVDHAAMARRALVAGRGPHRARRPGAGPCAGCGHCRA